MYSRPPLDLRLRSSPPNRVPCFLAYYDRSWPTVPIKQTSQQQQQRHNLGISACLQRVVGRIVIISIFAFYIALFVPFLSLDRQGYSPILDSTFLPYSQICFSNPASSSMVVIHRDPYLSRETLPNLFAL